MMNAQQQLMPPGTPCILQGLQAQPIFNGNAVSVVEFLHDEGRYRVQPMNLNGPLPPVLSIKPQNLQPTAAPMYQQQVRETPMGQLFPPGARFVLQGLLGQPAFNGQHVLVVEYLHDQERYRVQPADMNGPLPPTLAIRQQNLVPVAGQFPPGSRFVLQGLQAQPAFNGQHVLVIEYLHDQERYLVQPADSNGPLPPTLAVRPQNLVPAEIPNSLPRRQMVISIPENNEMHGSESDILSVGSTAILHGLKGQPALNGEMVVIDEYMEDQGRYRVTPVDPTESSMPALGIKPQNLLPCKDPRRRERNVSDHSSSFGASSCYGSQAFSSHCSSPSRSKAKSNASMTHLKPGSHARLTGLKKTPKLNGHMVRIVEYLRDKDRYRVEPLDVEAFDVCTADLMAIRPNNLISEDPMHGGAAPLASGTRAVLINLSGKPAFNGQLVTVIRYMAENRTYEVRPLGSRAPAKVLFLGPDKLKPAPQSAFWVQMTIKGHQLRLPVSCKVHRDNIGQANVHVMLDAFAGLDQVIPAAKVILGEDHCDWMDDGEVLAALKASKSQTITLDIQDEDAHAGLKRDEAFISDEKKPAIFEAMIEFELIKPTRKTVQVDLMGTLLVYQLKFPDTAQNETKAKALKTKRPPMQKSGSTRSVRSSHSVRSSESVRSALRGSKSLHNSSSVRNPRRKKERLNESEWKPESQSVPGFKKASRRPSLQSLPVAVVKNISRRPPIPCSSNSDGSKTHSRRHQLVRSDSVRKPHSMRHLLVRSDSVRKPHSMRDLLVRSDSSERRPQMEPPGSTHVPIRARASSQEEPADDDVSLAGDDDLQMIDVAALRDSLKGTDSLHSPKSVARTVPKEVKADLSIRTPSMMGDSYASLASELDMQDLLVHIEAKEKEKQELENSFRQLDKRLSLVQVTCVAASHKLTQLRRGEASFDVKERKRVKKEPVCDSSDSDSDDEDDSHKLTLLRGGKDSKDAKEEPVCDSSDSDSDDEDESNKLTLLRGGKDSIDVKETKDVKKVPVCDSSDSKETCSSDSDSD